MGKTRLVGRSDMKVAVIGDEDTVVGFCLAGVGAVEGSGKKSFYIVDEKSRPSDIEEAFVSFTKGDGLTSAGSAGSAKNGGETAGKDGEKDGEGKAATSSSSSRANNTSVLIITQAAANVIRNVVDDYSRSDQILPAVLEIPTKDAPYDATKDPIMQRVQMFFGDKDIMADEDEEK